MDINREELAWAAGLFEGEGYFSTRCSKTRPNNALMAGMKTTDEDVIRTFLRIVSIGTVTGPTLRPPYKPIWAWQAGSFEEVQAVMALLWTWLHTRRKERIKELLLQYKGWQKDLTKPRLTDEQINEILDNYVPYSTTTKEGTRIQDIADLYKVHRSTISSVVNGHRKPRYSGRGLIVVERRKR